MPVSATRKELVGSQVRYAEATDAAILTRNPYARVDERVTLFDTEAAAQVVADEMLATFGPKRAVYAVEVEGVQWELELGQTVTLTYDNLELSAVSALIISIYEDIDKRTTRLGVFV